MTEPMSTAVIQRVQQTHGWLLNMAENLPDSLGRG
jgi:hypothetical protein